MPGFLSHLRSTLSGNRAGERPPRPPSHSWTERSRLVDHDTGLGPRSGMFAVVWLNGVQVLIVFLKELPYNTRLPPSRRQHEDQFPRPQNVYEFVRPMPQANPFDMKAGRKFTLFLGPEHFLVELVEILSENPLQPLPEEYRHDVAAMQIEPLEPNGGGWLHTPPRTPPPNTHQTRNSPTNPTWQDAEPYHVQQDTANTVVETSGHHRRRSKRYYDKDLPSQPQPRPFPHDSEIPRGNLSNDLFGHQYSSARQDEPVVNSSPAKSSSRKSRSRRQKGKQAERYRDVPRSERRFFPVEGPSNGCAYCDQCLRPSNPASSRGASRHSNDTISRY